MRVLALNLVTLVMIAVMAIPAVSSPAFRHRHVDGDKSHQHGVASAERHEHWHSHGPKKSQSPRHSHAADVTKAKHAHDDRTSHSAQPPVEHLHVFWFGFEFSLPLSTPGHSDSPRLTASTEQWVPLISEVTLPGSPQDGSRILAVDLLMPTGLTPRLPARSEVRPLRQPAVALLCDTARRERSGVLVI